MSGGTGNLMFLLVLWVLAALGTITFRSLSGQRESGLVWAYMANLWLLHWPAAFIYTLPWYSRIEYPTVHAGFVQTVFGIFAFGVGAALIAPTVVKILEPPGADKADAAGVRPDALLPRTYLLVGIVSYAILGPLLGNIPTISALAVAATQLIIVGICLRCWHGWFTRNRWLFYSALLVTALVPFATVLGQGFLGYGAAAVITVLCFTGSFIKPRWKVAVAAVFVAYLGFSGYVTYMRDRGEIRRVVWGGESVTNRFTSVLGTVKKTELFDPNNPEHLARIDARLNQNLLVGASVQMLESGARDFAKGETVLQALISLVPRALWPDKPVYAGSPGIVTKYTGISFAEFTSVGIGQVMEFYVNFGTAGVIVGFLILGALVGMFDTWAAQRLWVGDWMQFAVWFLAGIGFIQAGGSLVEVVSTVGAGMLAAVLVNRHLVPMIHRWRADAAAVPTSFPTQGFDRGA